MAVNQRSILFCLEKKVESRYYSLTIEFNRVKLKLVFIAMRKNLVSKPIFYSWRYVDTQGNQEWFLKLER